MRNVYCMPFGADFLEGLKRFILRQATPLAATAIVFAGKRPALYMKRKLAETQGAAFYSPRFFAIEEFIQYVAEEHKPGFANIDDDDAVYLLYRAVRSLDAFDGHPLKRSGLDDFYYWGTHLFAFINELDMEDVPAARLQGLEKNAEIGYDVPPSVNDLLKNISILRQTFHEMLEERRQFSRGSRYLAALGGIEGTAFDEFENVYFAGLFGLTGVEKAIVKHVWQSGKGEVLIEGDPEEWPILKSLVTFLGAGIERIDCDRTVPERIQVYSGFDTHAECLQTYEILKETEDPKTVVVLPASEALFPLLIFALDRMDRPYNISMGYPVSRTTLFDLISRVLSGQIGRRAGGLYPVATYLRVVLHPFVKNLLPESRIRPLLLDIEKSLTGEFAKSTLAGKPFITLEEVENEAAARLGSSGFRGEVSPENAMQALKEVHRQCFTHFEQAATLFEFAEKLEGLLDFLLDHTPVRSYILSGEIFKRIFELLERLKGTEFSREPFDREEGRNRRTMCDFVRRYLRSAGVPFDTKPLEPLEIMGMLEARSIRFDRVVILDVNEGVIPQPRQVDPLVPLGIHDKLGIPSPEENEELYRYYFNRLIAGAREVHLIYVDAPEKPRSRYIEQILWNQEKQTGQLNAISVERLTLRLNLKPVEPVPAIRKTDGVVKVLSTRTYSPSELDDYIRCPVLFYYSRILGFQPRRQISEDIEATDRGSLIHAILFDTFRTFKDREIEYKMCDEVLGALHAAVTRGFADKLLTGDFYLFKKLAEYKLSAFIRKNVKDGGKRFVVKYLEETISQSIEADDISFTFRGRIDRIDFLPDDRRYVIMDYKTGGTRQYPRNILTGKPLYSSAEIHERVKSVQLPLYVHMLQKRLHIPLERVNAKLILLKTNEEESLFRDGPQDMREEIQNTYMRAAKIVLKDIVDPTKPFQRFADEACPDCAFNGLCHT
jgi:ATP-dependent helicase/nuclease subunit B